MRRTSFARCSGLKLLRYIPLGDSLIITSRFNPTQQTPVEDTFVPNWDRATAVLADNGNISGQYWGRLRRLA